MSHGAGPCGVKNDMHAIAFSNLEIEFFDASVHTDYYTARLTKVQDGRQVYWDSRKQAAR